MKFSSKLIFALYFLLLSTNLVCAQFTSTQTCLGGSSDDFLGTIAYNYFNSQNYSFKTKDGGSIYFGKSNSDNGTFAPNIGYYDIVIIKISSAGELEFTKNIGTVFSEHHFAVSQSNDSSNYFILIESYSNALYDENSNNKTAIQHSIKCINQNGNELWNKQLRIDEYNRNNISYYPSPNYENQINLFTDKQDNCFTFFEKIKFDSSVQRHLIDSIFYNKIDKNGNINWTNATTPFAIYNNTKPELRIDTFFNYSFLTNNHFAVTDNKFITSAFLSNNRAYSTALYSLDYNTGNISNSILIDSVNFNISSVKNNILLYGDKSIFNYNNNIRYSSFIYQKYDEELNLIYENLVPYDETETYSHYVHISPIPYFNSDSSKIWFDTYVSIIDFYYYGLYTSKLFVYANIIDQQTGTYIKQVDLNILESNFIVSKINDVFYYLSTNTAQDSTLITTINAYNFDGTNIHEQIIDSAFFQNNNPISLGSVINQSIYNNSIFCNIPNTFSLQSNTIDSIGNIKTGFIILDSLCNLVMNASDDNFSQNNLFNKFHVIDSSKFSLISTILQDTISGCYPNTNNIVLKVFSIPNLSSLNNLHKNDAKFLIFPNPNNGDFTIDFNFKGNYPITICLFDVTGRIVYQETRQHNNQSFIHISDSRLPSGLYNIQISSANDTWNKKVLIKK